MKNFSSGNLKKQTFIVNNIEPEASLNMIEIL
jgi:hypothetical protein